MKQRTTSIKQIVHVIFIVLFVNGLIGSANATTYYSRGSANFNTFSNWNTIPTGGGTIPTSILAGDNFIIQSGHTITATASVTITSLTIQNTGTLNMNTFGLTVTTVTLAGVLDLSTANQTGLSSKTINNSGGTGEIRMGSTVWGAGLNSVGGTFLSTATNKVTYYNGISTNPIPNMSYPTLNLENGSYSISNGSNVTINGHLNLTNVSSFTISAPLIFSATGVIPHIISATTPNFISLQSTTVNGSTEIGSGANVQTSSLISVSTGATLTNNNSNFTINSGGNISGTGTFINKNVIYWNTGTSPNMLATNMDFTSNTNTFVISNCALWNETFDNLTVDGKITTGAITLTAKTLNFYNGGESFSLGSGTNVTINGDVTLGTNTQPDTILFASGLTAPVKITIFGNLNGGTKSNIIYQNSSIVQLLDLKGANNNLNYFSAPVITGSTGSYVSYSGTVNQTMFASPSYKRLIINNTGGVVVMPGATSVGSSLKLLNGRLQIGNNTLSLFMVDTANTRTNGWIETNASGSVMSTVLGLYNFHVGNATNYQPIRMTNSTGSNYVRFKTPSQILPTGGIGSWVIFPAAPTTITALNPIGGSLNASSTFGKLVSGWVPLATSYTSPNYTSTVQIPAVNNEYALYTCPTLNIAGKFADGIKSQPYSSIIKISGGSNYVINSQSVPAGLSASLDVTGNLTLSGTPTTAINNYIISIDYTDLAGCSNIFKDTINIFACNPLVVTSVLDDGSCGTLRNAINYANTVGNCTIKFDLGSSPNPYNFNLNTALPTITGNGITIDGWDNNGNNGTPNTVPVFSATPTNPLNAKYKVILKNVGSVETGFIITGKRNIIKGFVLHNFGNGPANQNNRAITISSDSNQVLGCYIGVDSSGVTYAGTKTGYGIYIIGKYNSIGDGTPSGANLISGLTGDGNTSGIAIQIGDFTNTNIASFNYIRGNMIGLQKDGSTFVANSKQTHIHLVYAGTGNEIGGKIAGYGNVISGGKQSNGYGIFVNRGTGGNIISGNIIGLKADGKTTVTGASQMNGIYLSYVPNNIIGGQTINERNIISGNNNNGIYILGNTASNNTIKGNYIGLNITGTIAPTTSQAYGITIQANATQNRIGGNSISDRNVISGNSTIGIVIFNTTDNYVLGNIIGLQADGKSLVGTSSQGTGVSINTVSHTVIGGIGAGNIISGNGLGINISGVSTVGNVILNNIIGADINKNQVSGSAQQYGISVSNSTTDTVGSITLPNIISYNIQYGVYLSSASTIQLQENQIYCNTTNFSTGILSNVAYPTISGTWSPGTSSIQVSGMPSIGTKDIYFYKNTSCGKNQGETQIGKFTGQANGVTNTTINLSGVNSGDVITARYNASTGASSFSLPLTIIDLAPTTVTAATNITANGFTINWKAVTAPFLVLQISKDPTFATVDMTVNNITGTSTSKSFTKSNMPSFDPTKVYYVRMQTATTNSATDGQYSNIKAFSAILPPGSGIALNLNGTNQYANAGNDTTFSYNQTNNFTIEAWVKLDPTATGKNVIFSKRTQNTPYDGYGIALDNTSSVVRFMVDYGNSTSSSIISGFTFNTWNHIAVSFQGSSFSYYCNGILIGSGAGISFPKTIDIPRIGTYQNNINYFKGSIDEVRVWDTNRSLASIQATMCQKLVGNESNLVGYFRFDEGFGSTAENKAAVSSTDASLVNTPTWGTSAAAIGDVSTSLYLGGNTLTLTDGDAFTANGFTLTSSQGVQLYKVKQSPNATAFGSSIDSLQKNAYWGVFPVGITSYNLTYGYTANTAINGMPYEAGALLASRIDNTNTTWNKVSTINADIVTNTITTPLINGRSEIIAAFGTINNFWNGTINTDWNNAGNWSVGIVPTSSHAVTISGTPPNQPIISSNASAQSIILQTSAKLTINSTGILTVTNIITNNGTICNGGTISGTVTGTSVVVSPTVTASPIPICSGSSANISLTVSVGATVSWSRASVSGITPAISSDVTSTINEILTSTNTTSTNVIYKASASLSGCTSPLTNITLVVNPQPVITPIADQIVCHGNTTTTINFASLPNGSTFNWTNSLPTIGLAASGNLNNIPSFGVVNTGNTQVNAQIIAIPTLNSCIGKADTFLISVKPKPTLTAVSNQTYCANFTTTQINFGSVPSIGTTFTWTNNNTSIGLLASGTNNISTFTTKNTGNTPIVSTINVTPTLNGCVGGTLPFTITVNPTPILNTIVNQTYCAGNDVPASNFTTNVIGTNINWTNDNPAIGLVSTGAGNYVTFKANNTNSTDLVAKFIVTPTANTCVGTSQNFTITVNPLPNATIGFNVSSVCKTGTNPVLSYGGVAPSIFTIPVGLAINQTNGIVDLTNTNAGTYVVTNSIAASGACSAVSDTATLKITPAPSGSFNYSSGSFCKTGISQTPTLNPGSIQGVFSAKPLGLSINGVDGKINLGTSNSGTYKVYNTNAASGGCAKQVDSTTVTLTTAPDASFSYLGTTFCQSPTNLSPTYTIVGASAGVFSSTTGLVFISNSTGIVDLINSTPGTYIVTNTIPPLGSCVSSIATSSLIILPRAYSNLSQTSCSSYFFNGLNRTVSGIYKDTLSSKLGCDSIITLNLTIKQPSTNTISKTACGSYFFNGLNRTISGAYKDTLVNAQGCDSIITLNLTVNPLPNVKATASVNPVCLGAQTKLVGTGANIYTWDFGKIDNQLFKPSKDSLYTVTGKDINNCTATDTITIKVKNCTILSATISGIDTICDGKITNVRIDLTGKAPWNFIYNNGIANNTITGILTSPYYLSVSPAINTTYKLISVTDSLLNTSTNVNGIANVVLQSKPLVLAGNNTLICNNASQIQLNGTVKNAASSWTSTGTGTFADTQSDTTTYNLSTSDKSLGTIFFYLESNSKFCTKVIDTLEYTLDKYPTANAGNDTLICDDLQLVYLHGKKTGAATGVTWTSNGSGTFNNQNAANADYTFSTSDLTKSSIAFYMKTTGGQGVCPQVIDTVNVSFKATPKLTFISQMDNICNGDRLGIKVKSSIISASISWSTKDDTGIIPSASGTGDSLSTIPVGVGVLDYQFVAISNGCTSKYLIGSVVLKNCLKAAYSVNKSILSSLSDTVIFTNTSTGGTIDSYLWNFGTDANPQTSTSAGPIKVVFSKTGKKVVSLTVKSGSVTNTYTDSLVQINSKLQIIVSESNVTQSKDSIIANLNISNGKSYTWLSEPANAVTFSNNSDNPVIKFANGISGKITVKAIVTFTDNRVDSSQVLLIRNGEYQVSVSKTKAFYFDTIPVSVNFKGTGPFQFKYQIGKDSATIRGITTNAYTFNVSSPGQLNVLRIYDKDNVPINYVGSMFPFVVLDTVSSVKQSSTSTLCTVATSKLYLDIAGGKSPYILSIGSNSYTVNAKDTLDIAGGKYTGTITDAAGYITQNKTFVVDTLKSNFNTIVPKIQGDTAILAQINVQNLNVNVDLNNLSGLGNNLNYVWTYTQNPIVNSLSSSTSVNTNTIKVNGNASGTVNLQVLVYTGTCSTAVSTPYKIHIKPNIVKNSESNKTELIYDLIGTAPFRLNMLVDSVNVDTTVRGNQFKIYFTNIKKLGVIRIKDFSGEVYNVNINEENQGEFIFYEAFSPNNDMKNETFEIGNYMYDKNTKFIKTGWDLKVYDRNGFEVFRDPEYKNNWNGGDLADGVYFWVFTNPKPEPNEKDKYGGFIEIRR